MVALGGQLWTGLREYRAQAPPSFKSCLVTTGLAPMPQSRYRAAMLERIRRLLKSTPFRPFEIHTSGGEIFRIAHPENAAVLNHWVSVAMPDGENAAMTSALHTHSRVGIVQLEPEQRGLTAT